MTRQQYDNWLAEIRGDENGSTTQAMKQMSMPNADNFELCKRQYIDAVKKQDFDTAHKLHKKMEEIKLKQAIKINIEQSQPIETNVKTHLVSTKEFVAWARAKRSHDER